jgi:DNA-directed RNA polymerase subunit RPC12/RpoP
MKERLCIRCGQVFEPWEEDPERCARCDSPQVDAEYPSDEDDDEA